MVSDFRLGIQFADHAIPYPGPITRVQSWSEEGVTRYTNYASQGDSSSEFASDANSYDPDIGRVYLDVNENLPSWEGLDFRVGLQATDNNNSETGQTVFSPWASNGGGFSDFAFDSNRYDPDAFKIVVDTKPWPIDSQYILSDFRIGMQAVDNMGASGIGSLHYTDWASKGDSSSAWVGDSNLYDPDALRVHLDLILNPKTPGNGGGTPGNGGGTPGNGGGTPGNGGGSSEPPKPAIDVEVQGSDPDNDRRVDIGVQWGQQSTITVKVEGSNNYTGNVELSVENLPLGVTVIPRTVYLDPNNPVLTTELTLTTQQGATIPGESRLRVVADPLVSGIRNARDDFDLGVLRTGGNFTPILYPDTELLSEGGSFGSITSVISRDSQTGNPFINFYKNGANLYGDDFSGLYGMSSNGKVAFLQNAASGLNDHSFSIVNLDLDPNLQRTQLVFSGQPGEPDGIFSSPDGTLMVIITSRNGKAYANIYDVAKGSRIRGEGSDNGFTSGWFPPVLSGNTVTLPLTNGRNITWELDGIDFIRANPFPPIYNNPIEGTEGEDQLIGTNIADEINALEGNDFIDGQSGDDVLNGGQGDDELYGGDGNDTLDGSWGFDTLDGGDGIDTVTYDFYNGGINASLMTGIVSFPGNSTITERLVSIENITGSRGNDYLYGTHNNNTLDGNDGNDYFNGQGGDDILNGGEGNDILIGLQGNDTLSGGEGSDRFVYGVNQGTDVIRDFNPTERDRIDFSLDFVNLENGFHYLENVTYQGVSGVGVYWDDVATDTSPGQLIAVLQGQNTNQLSLNAPYFQGAILS